MQSLAALERKVPSTVVPLLVSGVTPVSQLCGLAHAPCHTGGDNGEGAYYSVMAISCPYDAKDELQTHDINDINDIDAKY